MTADDLAASIAAQAGMMWGQLPDGEVDDDEELHFRTDDYGRLMVATRFAWYKLAWDTDMEKVTVWRWRPDVAAEWLGPGWLEQFTDRELVAGRHIEGPAETFPSVAWN